MSVREQYSESILLPDVLSIRNISDIHSKITALFENNDSVVLDIPDRAEADLSFVQLIEAVRRHAEANDKVLALAAPANGHVLKVLERAGFLEAFSGEDTKFWLHEEVKP
ncbi:STAS domain-containing protein [Rhizobium sp. 18055]|uniref:STAS domain-containing protein n=1 Tax=Rhizobium sp. 18055 TaxID=2681403 RepID=UPI0013596E79|nr:STAS domain-containing protein [Rhizobium sp. 18055]